MEFSSGIRACGVFATLRSRREIIGDCGLETPLTRWCSSTSHRDSIEKRGTRELTRVTITLLTNTSQELFDDGRNYQSVLM